MPDPTMICVLRTGGEYTPSLVVRLRDSLAKHAPGRKFVCLTDTPIAGVECKFLDYDWPGWWAKMELFRPDIKGDLLFFDLDTIVVGDVTPLLGLNRLAMLRDFYRKDHLGSGLMYLPEAYRAEIWNDWCLSPARFMAECGSLGDQNFLERYWLGKAARIQDLVGEQVLSYKVHVRGQKHLPRDARVVCFHGKPRPWEIGWELPPREE